MAVASAPPRLVYRPQSKQEPWHACPAFESGFGGTKGPGKTLAMLMEATRGVGHSRYRAIIFRRTYKRLQEVMDRAWEWFPPLGAKWNGDHARWTFPSGAMISMRHCENEEDKRIYHGHEYHFMAFDQLEEFSETQYTFLMAQCRSSVPEIKPYLRTTFNPGGIGHAWVKERFLSRGTRDCAPWTPRNEQGDPLPTRCFHFSNIYDNQILLDADPQYMMVLNSLPEQDRRALRDGDWDVFAGQVLTEWRREKHVIDPIPLDKDWQRVRMTDYGSARPFVTLWAALDKSVPRVYIYREISQPGLLASQQAQAVVSLTGEDEKIRLHVADPAMWIKSPDSGKSIAQIYFENGVTLTHANNDRLNGLARVREYLKDAPDGRPHLQVFSSCIQLIKNLPSLVYDAHKVEDVDTDGPDDEYDALRYGLMAMESIPDFSALATSMPLGFSTGATNGRPTQPTPVPDFTGLNGKSDKDARLAALFGEWQSTGVR
ncbi:MAG TPA: terminase family protein [Candidatus Saccharimonadia bacterium]|nr:terminase family protein [Candidatus Saccharimonadia bacterium]